MCVEGLRWSNLAGAGADHFGQRVVRRVGKLPQAAGAGGIWCLQPGAALGALPVDKAKPPGAQSCRATAAHACKLGARAVSWQPAMPLLGLNNQGGPPVTPVTPSFLVMVIVRAWEPR